MRGAALTPGTFTWGPHIARRAAPTRRAAPPHEMGVYPRRLVLEPPQQPIDILQLVDRPITVAAPGAQFAKDLAGALDVAGEAASNVAKQPSPIIRTNGLEGPRRRRRARLPVGAENVVRIRS